MHRKIGLLPRCQWSRKSFFDIIIVDHLATDGVKSSRVPEQQTHRQHLRAGFRDRMLGDDGFIAKLGIELGIGLFCKVMMPFFCRVALSAGWRSDRAVCYLFIVSIHNARAVLVGRLVLGTHRAPTHRAELLALASQLAAEKNKRGKAFKSQIDFVCANVVSSCSAPYAEAHSSCASVCSVVQLRGSRSFTSLAFLE